jgi:hypothetical protein
MRRKRQYKRITEKKKRYTEMGRRRRKGGGGEEIGKGEGKEIEENK